MSFLEWSFYLGMYIGVKKMIVKNFHRGIVFKNPSKRPTKTDKKNHFLDTQPNDRYIF